MIDTILIDDCITQLDGSSLQAALTHVHSAIESGDPDGLIPFPPGSNAWCFSFLILYKPWSSLYTKDRQPLLQPHQSAKDALMENGMICANHNHCHAVGVGPQAVPLKRCARCHICFYCSVKCQKQHWKSEHLERCNDHSCWDDDGSNKVRFVVGDTEERNFRESAVKEMQTCQQFARQHPLPDYEKMFLLYQFSILQRQQQQQQLLLEPGEISEPTQSYHGFIVGGCMIYTRGVHDQVERMYQSLGKNSFEANLISLVDYLDQCGGAQAVNVVYGMVTHLFTVLDENNVNSKVALLSLKSVWERIGSWRVQRGETGTAMMLTMEKRERHGNFDDSFDNKNEADEDWGKFVATE